MDNPFGIADDVAAAAEAVKKRAMNTCQSPLERAAWALRCAQQEEMAKANESGEPLTQTALDMIAARAVLMALREPSNAMLNAGNDGVYDQSGDTNPFVIWQDMIDAAMTEGEGA